MHNMKSTITVVEENGKGCIDYHDAKGDDRQDPILWRKKMYLSNSFDILNGMQIYS